jgi:hypothetical protein
VKLPFYILCLLLFLFPFQKVTGTVELSVVTFNPFTIGIVSLSFFALLKNLSPRHSFGFSVMDVLMIMFCLTYFASTILSDDILGSGRLAFRSVFIPVVSYFTIKSLVTSDKEYKWVLSSAIAGVASFAVIALVTVGLTGDRESILDIPPIGMATLAIFAICNLVFTKLWPKRIGLIAMAPCVLLLVMTLARAYLVGTLASPLVFRLIRKGHAFRLYALFFLGALALTLLISMYPNYITPGTKRIVGTKSYERVTDIDYWKHSLRGRAFSYREGLGTFRKNPVFGTGLQIGDVTVTRHNFHIEWLEYGGLVGYTICIVFFLSYPAIQKNVAMTDAFCAANLCVVILILLNSLTNGIMHGLMPHLAFISMGLAESRRRLTRDTSAP